jgi:hypothetical protein
MLQILLSCSPQPELSFADTDRVEVRVGIIAVRLVAVTAVFLRPWTVPAFLEAVAWVMAVQSAINNKDSKDFIVLYKQIWWRRAMAALAFFALEAATVTRVHPPLITVLLWFGVVEKNVRVPCWLLAIVCTAGVLVGTDAVELGVLGVACFPLWLHGFWVPRTRRSIPMAVLYKLQFSALLYEVAIRVPYMNGVS